MIDQSTVDETTELWLGELEKKLDYKWWYAGHYHTSRVRDKLRIMFEDIEMVREVVEREEAAYANN